MVKLTEARVESQGALSELDLRQTAEIRSRVGQNEEFSFALPQDLNTLFGPEIDLLRLERVARVEQRTSNMFRTNIPSDIE